MTHSTCNLASPYNEPSRPTLGSSPPPPVRHRDSHLAMPVPPLHSNYPHTATLESAHSVWDQLRTEDRTSFPAVDDRPEQRIRFPAPSSQADWLLPLGLGTHLPFTSSSGAFIEPLRRVTASTARGSERGRWATDSFSTSIQAPNSPVHERWLYDGGSRPELSTSSSRYAPANNAMPPSFAAATAPSPSVKRQTAPHSVSNYTTEAAKPFLVGPVLKVSAALTGRCMRSF